MATNSYIAALPDFVMQHIIDDRQFVRLPYRGAMPSRMLSIWHSEEIGGHPLLKDFCRRFVGFVERAPPDERQRLQATIGRRNAEPARQEVKWLIRVVRVATGSPRIFEATRHNCI